MISVTAGDWIALSALILTGLTMAGGVVYRLGQLTGAVRDLARRVSANEIRLARIDQKLERRRSLADDVEWVADGALAELGREQRGHADLAAAFSETVSVAEHGFRVALASRARGSYLCCGYGLYHLPKLTARHKPRCSSGKRSRRDRAEGLDGDLKGPAVP